MAANIWGYDLPKSWRKDEIARSMAYEVKTPPKNLVVSQKTLIFPL